MNNNKSNHTDRKTRVFSASSSDENRRFYEEAMGADSAASMDTFASGSSSAAAAPAKRAAAGSGRSGSSKNGKKKKKKTKKKLTAGGIILRILLVLLIVLLIACAGVAIWVMSILKDTPNIDPNEIYTLLSQSSEIYDSDGKKIDTVFVGSDRKALEYDQIPEDMLNAIVALEDKTFWTHNGFNIIRIFGAIKEALTSGGRVSGTSTITQQLARNVFLREDMEKHDIKRKIREAYYTVILERNLSKKQIIEAYLNTIFLGFNCDGIEAAAQAYFSKSAKDLTLVECATLAALPSQPSTLALITSVSSDSVSEDADNIVARYGTTTYLLNDASTKRRNLCLDLMLQQGMITQKEHDAAVKVKLKDIINPTITTETTETSYFADYVIEQVISDLQEEYDYTYAEAWDKVYKGGLRIYSTMDSQAQGVIEKEFEDPNNFPNVTAINYDASENIVGDGGLVLLFKKSNIINDEGNFTFYNDDLVVQDDGSYLIKAGRRLKIYNTEANGTTDYSLEFPKMYLWDNYHLFAIPGGYINIPAEYKSRNDDGDLIIDAKFLSTDLGKSYFGKDGDGNVILKPASYSLNQQVIQPQAAMSVIENSTGRLKAMVGGRGVTGRMIYNRATATRQPGSSIKPLAVYSAALQQSAEEAAAGKVHNFQDYGIDLQGTKGWGKYITAGSICVDEETTVKGKVWPKNSGGSYTGKQTVRTALMMSLNTCAVKIIYQVGTTYSANMVKKFGITSLVEEGEDNDVNVAALALGGLTNGVSTLEMAHAYTTFANNGEMTKDIYCYTKVTTASGSTLLETSDKPEMTQVLNPDVAYVMRRLLQNVLTYGAYANAGISGVSVGGKTGTTDNKFDIWFDGFTPTYSASLWIGNDVNIKLTQMGVYAAGFWGKIMRQITAAGTGSYPDMPSTVEVHGGEYYAKGTYSVADYDPPSIEKVKICKDTGMLATPSCKHTETKRFDTAKDQDPPKYYCHEHNPDRKKYPVSPSWEKKLREQEKAEAEEAKRKQEEEEARKREEEQQQQQEQEPEDEDSGKTDSGNEDKKKD